MTNLSVRTIGAFVLALLLPLAVAASPPGMDRIGGESSSGPQRGDWLLDVDPAVTRGETAQQLSLDLLAGSEALLQVFDFGQPLVEERLQAELDALRARLLDARPEDLQQLADRSGPGLAALHQAFSLQVGTQLARAAADRAESGPAAPKSAGFPSLPPGLPAYPAVTARSAIVNLVISPFSEGAIEDALGGVARVFAEVDLPFCRVEPGADGRAERRSNETVYADTVAIQLQHLLYDLQEDGCGGAAADATVVSLGLSCDICCIPYALVNGIANLIYETGMLCDDMVDTAEIEAAWHAGKTAVDGLTHLHGDVERVQGTADDILDIVSCKPVGALLRGHGCDGFDSDCDGLVDECDEDVFGPDLHVDEAVSAPWYGSLAEAREAVLRAVSVSDACRAVSVDLAPLSGACGSVEAVVTAVDDCGNTSIEQAIVRVDAVAPTVTIPRTLEGSCQGSVGAAENAVLAAASISDDCTPAGELVVAVESSVTDCSLRVRLTVTDRAGRVASDAVTLSVDSRTPSALIDRVALATLGPKCFDSVAEAEEAVAAFVRTSDNCSDGAALAPVMSSSGDPCSLSVRATVTDDCGHAASDSVEVRVDGSPPLLDASVVQPELRPANHELVNVGLSIAASDDCAGEPEIRVRVTSDEPTASASGAGGDNGPDAVLLRQADGTIGGLMLRAERSSSGNGRVYHVSVEAIDPCGHSTTSVLEVSVPPNGNAAAVDDGQFYDATAWN